MLKLRLTEAYLTLGRAACPGPRGINREAVKREDKLAPVRDPQTTSRPTVRSHFVESIRRIRDSGACPSSVHDRRLRRRCWAVGSVKSCRTFLGPTGTLQ